MTRAHNWFLIRGLVREAAHWGDFPARLRERLDGDARVFHLDLPGNGRLHREASPLSVPAMVDRVRRDFHDVLRELGPEPGPCYLLAFSLGGMVALDWAQRHPAELDGAVLGNTSVRGLSPPHHRMRLQAAAFIARTVVTSDTITRERRILGLTSNRHEVHDEVATSWRAIAEARPVSRANALRQVVAAARYRPDVQRKPEVPLLLLNGARDRLVEPSCSVRIRDHWGVEMRQHPTAGHELAMDAGPWVADRVADWLQRSRQDAATRAVAPDDRA